MCACMWEQIEDMQPEGINSNGLALQGCMRLLKPHIQIMPTITLTWSLWRSLSNVLFTTIQEPKENANKEVLDFSHPSKQTWIDLLWVFFLKLCSLFCFFLVLFYGQVCTALFKTTVQTHINTQRGFRTNMNPRSCFSIEGFVAFVRVRCLGKE